MAAGDHDILILSSDYEEDNASILQDLLQAESSATAAYNINQLSMVSVLEGKLETIDEYMSKTLMLMVLMSEDWCRDKEMKGQFMTALQRKFNSRKGLALMRVVYMLPEGCRSHRELPYYDKLPAYITMIMNINWKLDNPKRFIQTVATLVENIKKMLPPPRPATPPSSSPSPPPELKMDVQDQSSNKYMDILRKQRIQLLQNMTVEEELLSHLLANDVISETDKERIETLRVRTDKCAKLVDIVSKRGPGAFEKFVEALRQTSQHHLADSLMGEYDVEPTVYSERKPQQPESETISQEQPESKDETDEMEVKIQKCDFKQAKTLMKSDKVYKMSSNPRGRAVIINNYTFDDSEKNRIGADNDTINLDNLLKLLGFTVKAYKNQKSQQIRAIIRGEQQSQKHGDCFILFLLSHGDSKHIYGVQREADPVDVDKDIVEKFYANVCPQLEGKPVLIFCGACRERAGVDEVTQGIGQISLGITPTPDSLLEQETEEGVDDVDANPSTITSPKKAKQTDAKHIFKFNATVDGFKAFRQVDLGTYFVRAIVDVFSKHCHKDHIITLFKMVQCELEKKDLVPSYEARSYMDLYFFPEYYE